jgi:hypothetical protein
MTVDHAVQAQKNNGAVLLQTPAGKHLVLDKSAKLEVGATVAVFMGGFFMHVGRLVRRPTPHRRFVISQSDVDGNKSVTRICGPKDEGVQVIRVTGVFMPVLFRSSVPANNGHFRWKCPFFGLELSLSMVLGCAALEEPHAERLRIVGVGK